MVKNLANTGISLIIDWFSFTGSFSSWNSAVEFLGLSQYYDDFIECPANDFYTEAIRFNDIVIKRGNRNKIDSYMIELKGRGCRSFETYSEFTLDEYLLPMVYSMGFNVCRIDLALDLQGHKITIDKFVNAYDKGLYKSKAKFTTLIRSDNKGIIGYSLYFGVQGANTRINIYDKRAERQFDDTVDSWVRFELRLRHRNANNFLYQYCESDESIGYLFWGVVNNYLCFLKKSNDKNENRWPSAPWWDKLRQHSEKISVFTQPGVEYDFSKYEHDIIKQCGSRIKFFLSSHSAFELWQRIEKSDISLNEKQIEMLKARKGIEDVDLIV